MEPLILSAAGGVRILVVYSGGIWSYINEALRCLRSQ